MFDVNNTAGIKNPDGSFFTVGQPITNIASLNEVNPNGPFYSSNVAAPQIRQPFTSQSSVGLVARVHAVDGARHRLHALGRQGPRRPLAAEHAHPGPGGNGPRRYADLPLNPANPTMNMSIGESRYDGINFGIRRRMTNGIQLNAWYTLAKATGRGGQAVDELTTNLVQDSTRPARRRPGRPGGADRRAPQGHDERDHPGALGHHGVAGLPLPLGAADAHLVRLRQQPRRRQQRHLSDRLPVQGRGRCGQSRRSRRWARARRSTAAAARRCRRSTCAWPRRSRSAARCGSRCSARCSTCSTRSTRRSTSARSSSASVFTGTLANHTGNTVFMKPNAYAGDNGQPEQRVGQMGFRFVF